MKTFIEYLTESKEFEKVAKKAAEKYGSTERGKKVAAAAMWKAADKAGASRSKVAKAAKKGEDIELNKMSKYR